MTPVVIAGSAHPALGAAVAAAFGASAACNVKRFPDGELDVAVEGVAGRDVFVVQPLAAPIGEALLELVLIADACRRSGATAVSAVVPYLGYARQERRTREGQPLGAKVVARLVSEGGFARVILVDLHAAAGEGFFATPVEHVTAVPLLAAALASCSGDSVVVAPDLGAAKLARRLAATLKLPTAIVYKTRVSGNDVTAGEIVGAVRGLRPILVDDMISTGGTIAEATSAVVAAGALPEVTVVATHGLFVGPASKRLRPLPIVRWIVTDTLPRQTTFLPLELVTVAPLLADTIRRVAEGRRLGAALAAT